MVPFIEAEANSRSVGTELRLRLDARTLLHSREEVLWDEAGSRGLIHVLVSGAFNSKATQTGWLKTELYCPTVLGAGIPSQGVGWASSF